MRSGTSYLIITLIILSLIYSCNRERPAGEVEAWQDEQEYKTAAGLNQEFGFRVQAIVESSPVPRRKDEDAADDPAIWVHPSDPSRSVVFGTDKQGGLGAYDLQGNELKYYDIGKVNNVDVRYGMKVGQMSVDLLAASNRSNNSLLIFLIDTATGMLEEVPGNEVLIKEDELDDVYGLCLYHPVSSGKFYAFINGKNGRIHQYEIIPEQDSIKLTIELARSFMVPSQPEGMVTDDELGVLYIGEEGAGIWKFPADPGNEALGSIIPMTGEGNKDLRFDLEGLALYCGSMGKGYLIASSQGSFSYAVFAREGANQYYGSFVIDGSNGVDAAEETDGLDVVNLNLAPGFSRGLLVVQDGFNHEGDSLGPQNFKYINFGDVATEMNLPYGVDTVYTGWMSR